MSPANVPPIGERVRAERVRQGLTLRGLARDIGVSASHISQVETGKSQPSVSTLYAITTALRLSIEELFEVPGECPDGVREAPLSPSHAEQPAAAGRAVAANAQGRAPATLATEAGGADDRESAGQGAAEGVADDREGAGADMADDGQGAADDGHTAHAGQARRVGPVVGPDDRETLTLDSGVIWELLGRVPGTQVDFLRVTYLPGGSSSSSGLLMRHSGTEYGYLLTGELTLTLGFEEHRLGPGDAISFDSTTPHGYRNEGNEPAVGIWVVLGSSG